MSRKISDNQRNTTIRLLSRHKTILAKNYLTLSPFVRDCLDTYEKFPEEFRYLLAKGKSKKGNKQTDKRKTIK